MIRCHLETTPRYYLHLHPMEPSSGTVLYLGSDLALLLPLLLSKHWPSPHSPPSCQHLIAQALPLTSSKAGSQSGLPLLILKYSRSHGAVAALLRQTETGAAPTREFGNPPAKSNFLLWFLSRNFIKQKKGKHFSFCFEGVNGIYLG